MGQRGKYRLLTRSDFDGLVCAVLLRELDMIDEIEFTHPKDMQDGKVPLNGADITTNLPYVKGVYLAFDHHHSEAVRIGKRPNHILDPEAPSAARVVYNYYGANDVFPHVDTDLLCAVDKCDSAQLSRKDVLNPQGWMLLNYIMDARTGLGRFRKFRISNRKLMLKLIDLCQDHSIEEILEHPDVKERVTFFHETQGRCIEQIRKCARIEGNLVQIDLRDQDIIWPGNRFLIYTLFPECNISMHILNGKDNSNTTFAIGKSIFNRSSRTNVGELCLAFHGGGHLGAGSCQVANQQAEKVRMALTGRITMDG